MNFFGLDPLEEEDDDLMSPSLLDEKLRSVKNAKDKKVNNLFLYNLPKDLEQRPTRQQNPNDIFGFGSQGGNAFNVEPPSRDAFSFGNIGPQEPSGSPTEPSQDQTLPEVPPQQAEAPRDPFAQALQAKLPAQNPTVGAEAYASDPAVYDADPNKEYRHKQAYGRTYNLHPSEVTRDDLLAIGSQQAEMPGEVRQANISTPEGNANFYGSDNAQQRGKYIWDIKKGAAQDIAMKSPRSLVTQVKDVASRAAITGISGVVNTAVEVLQFADPTKLMFDEGLATKLNSKLGITQGTANTVKAAREALISPQERYAENKMYERLQQQQAVNEKNKAKLIKDGYSPEYATAATIVSDLKDALIEVYRDPARAVSIVADAIPSVITTAVAAKLVVTKVMKLLPTNPAAAKIAAEAAGITVGAIQEATSLSVDIRNNILDKSEEDLKKSSQYMDYRSKGMSHEEAKTALADDASTVALGTQFAVSAISSKLTGAGKFEGNLLLPKAGKQFQQNLGERALRGGIKTGAASLTETGQEGTESGSAPLITNVLGQKYLGEQTPLSRGVGTQAGLGMVGGGLMGGGLSGIQEARGVASQGLSGPNVNRKAEAIPKTPQAQAINQSITNAAREVDLPPIGEAYLRAIAETESTWGENNLGAVLSDGDRAKGPFQFRSGTATRYGIKDPMNPQQAALGAARMLKENYTAIKKAIPNISDEEAYLRAAVAHHQGLGGVLGGTAGTESTISQQDYGTNAITFRDPAQQQGMRPETLQALSSIGIPITINSGHRTKEYNASIGGAKDSQHIQGTAADISMEGMYPTQRVELVQRLSNKGFTYFMTYDDSGHLHADMREGSTKFNHKSGMGNAPDWLKQAQAQIGTGSQSTGTMPNLGPKGQQYLTDMKSRVSKYFGSRGFESISAKERGRGVLTREEIDTLIKGDEDTVDSTSPEDKSPKSFDFYRKQPKEYYKNNPQEFARFKEAFRNKADELEPLVQPLSEDSQEYAALTKDFFDATARIKETDEFLRSDVVTPILDRLNSTEVLSVTPSQKYGTPNDSGSINLSSTVSNYELSSLVEAAKSGVLKEEDYKKIAAANPNNLPEPIKNILTQYTPNVDKARELYKAAKAISPEMAKVALAKFGGAASGSKGFTYHQQNIMDGMIQNIAEGTLIWQSKNALMSFDNFVGTQQKKLKTLEKRDTSKYSEEDLDTHNTLLAQVQEEQVFLEDVLRKNLLAYENLRKIINKRRAEILPSIPDDKKGFYDELDPYSSQVVRTQLTRGTATSSKSESSPKEETTSEPSKSTSRVTPEYYTKAKNVASYNTTDKTEFDLKTALNNINRVLQDDQFKNLTEEQKAFLQKKHTEVSEALKKLSETAVKPPQKPSKPEVVPEPRVEAQKPPRAPTQPSETASEELTQKEQEELNALIEDIDTELDYNPEGETKTQIQFAIDTLIYIETHKDNIKYFKIIPEKLKNKVHQQLEILKKALITAENFNSDTFKTLAKYWNDIDTMQRAINDLEGQRKDPKGIPTGRTQGYYDVITSAKEVLKKARVEYGNNAEFNSRLKEAYAELKKENKKKVDRSTAYNAPEPKWLQLNKEILEKLKNMNVAELRSFAKRQRARAANEQAVAEVMEFKGKNLSGIMEEEANIAEELANELEKASSTPTQQQPTSPKEVKSESTTKDEVTTTLLEVPIEKVISGGQDGIDLIGLQVAKRLGIPTGGTMPKGFKTIYGNNPKRATDYNLSEHSSDSYVPRTIDNINNSDVTIAFHSGNPGPGTSKTIGYAQTGKWQNGNPITGEFTVNTHKPILAISSKTDKTLAIQQIKDFLHATNPKIINIAGSRPQAELQTFTAEVLIKGLSKSSQEFPTVNETPNTRVRIDPKVARVVLVDAYRAFLDCK